MVEAPRSTVPVAVTSPLPARLMMPRPARLVVLTVTLSLPLAVPPEKIPEKVEVVPPAPPGFAGLLSSLHPASAIRPRMPARQIARIRFAFREIARAPCMMPPASYDVVVTADGGDT